MRRWIEGLDMWQALNFFMVLWGLMFLWYLSDPAWLGMAYGAVLVIYGLMISGRWHRRFQDEATTALVSAANSLKIIMPIIVTYKAGPVCDPEADRTTKMIALADWLDKMDDGLGVKERSVQESLRAWAREVSA